MSKYKALQWLVRVDGTRDGTKREEMGWRWDADKLSKNKWGFC